MQCPCGVWFDPVSTASAQDFFDLFPFQGKAGMSGFPEHPFEGDLCKTTFILDVPASHIGVHPRKPNLFDILARKRFAPQILTEEAPPFIDRKGMSSNTEVRILAGVRDVRRVPNPTDRTDCIPHSNEVGFARARERRFEAIRFVKRRVVLLAL